MENVKVLALAKRIFVLGRSPQIYKALLIDCEIDQNSIIRTSVRDIWNDSKKAVEKKLRQELARMALELGVVEIGKPLDVIGESRELLRIREDGYFETTGNERNAHKAGHNTLNPRLIKAIEQAMCANRSAPLS